MANEVLESWEENAGEWIDLLDREGIASRRITNLAIINAAMNYAVGSIIDLGCGEGWLTRALSDRGQEVIGVDGTAALIYKAQEQSSDPFHYLTYEDIIKDPAALPLRPDTVLFNYSLYGDEPVGALIASLNAVLMNHGRIILQTVHPHFLMKDNQPYVSRWVDNAWEGLDGDFKSPHRWFCRTMEDWITTLNKAGYRLAHLSEPISSDGAAISLILVAEKI